MAIAYTKKMLIQRIRGHMSNGFPNDAFSMSENQILLYIDQALAFQIVGTAYAGAKIEGALVMPEAFIITYALSLTQDSLTQEWVATLPQPPLSLPLGYSINRAYFSVNGFESEDVIWIKAKRTGYRNMLPGPTGIYGRVINKELRLKSDANPLILYGYTVYVEMPSARTTDVTAAMNVPDDVIEAIFNDVVKQLMQRYQEPKDIVHDDLPAGNKSS